MDCSTPGFPVLHQLQEFAQVQIHWVSDALQPSHPLLPPSPFAFHLSQHQGLFQWVSSSHQVAKVLGVSASASVLAMNIQGWFPLGLTGSISYMYTYIPSLLDLPPNPTCHPAEVFKLIVIRKTWLYFYKVIWTRMINTVIRDTWVIESDEGDESCGSQGSMSSKDPSTKDPANSFVCSRYDRTAGGMIPSIL